MEFFERTRFLLKISHPSRIARRYLATNGFDGALTMLGLTIGFALGGDVALSVAIHACLAAAIALGMSGLSSAYISEAAERTRELQELEEAMVVDLDTTAHGKAARFVPFVIAIVNGFSPFAASLLIILPMWLTKHGVQLPLGPFGSAIAVGFFLIFLLGAWLGRISGVFWLWMGLRTLFIALVTGALVLLIRM